MGQRTDYKMKALRDRISSPGGSGLSVRMFRMRPGNMSALSGGGLPTIRKASATLIGAAPDTYLFYNMTGWPLILIGTGIGIMSVVSGHGSPRSKGLRSTISHQNEDGSRETEGLQDLYFRCGQYLPSKGHRYIDPGREVGCTVASALFGMGGAGLSEGITNAMNVGHVATPSTLSTAVEIGETTTEAGLGVLEVSGLPKLKAHGRWNEEKYPPLFYVEFRALQAEGFQKLQFSNRGRSHHDRNVERTLYKWKDMASTLIPALESKYWGRRSK